MINLEDRVITNSVGPCGSCGHELDRSDERCPFCSAVNHMGPGRPNTENTATLHPKRDEEQLQLQLPPGEPAPPVE